MNPLDRKTGEAQVHLDQSPSVHQKASNSAQTDEPTCKPTQQVIQHVGGAKAVQRAVRPNFPGLAEPTSSPESSPPPHNRPWEVILTVEGRGGAKSVVQPNWAVRPNRPPSDERGIFARRCWNRP